MRHFVPQTITPVTRRDITDYIAANNVRWWGRQDEVAFLARVFPDIEERPSTDPRFSTASGDIRQHRQYNYDWEDDWIFDDERFGLRSGPDELFVQFLSQTLHPLVRSDQEEVKRLLADFNQMLEADDWELVEVGQISGRPVYEGRRREAIKAPVESIDIDAYENLLDPQVLREHLRRIDRDLKSDPAAAIGSSKELVESVLKAILEDYEIEYKTGDDLMDLYKKVQECMSLNAGAVPDDAKGSLAAVKALRALVTTVQSLAELRNALGTGHGPSRRSAALTRHARLAFNSSIAVTTFLLDTWHERKPPPLF
jgi:AbiJ N-terminal domain 3/Abortive infection C-terminus